MIKDALGNKLRIDSEYDDGDEVYTVVDFTESGQTVYEWFGQIGLASPSEVKKWYPRGQYPQTGVESWAIWLWDSGEMWKLPQDVKLDYESAKREATKHQHWHKIMIQNENNLLETEVLKWT